MNNFFDFIERHKFGLIGTALLHVIIFFALNFYYFEVPEGEIHVTQDIEIPLEEISLEDLSQEEVDEEGNVINSGEIKNTVVDQNDDREKSMDNYSRKSMDQQVEDELKQLEEETFQQLNEGREPGSKEEEPYEHVTDKELEEMAREHLDQGNNGGNKGYAGRAIATFDLPGREEVKIRIPSYTCRGSGTVVVRVKVNVKGEVTTAKYAPELSYRPTDCMIEKAQSYAAQSKFDYNPDADDPQSGTITYEFIAQ